MKNGKIVKYLVIAVVLFFLIHQAYSALYKPVETKSAEYYETVDGIKANGTIIRSESYVTAQSGGALHFLAENGTRVAKGGTVAAVYDSAATSATVSQIDEISKRLADIEALQKYNSVTAADLGLADQKVTEALSDVITSSKGGNISESADKSGELLSALCRRRMITGEETDFTAQHDALAAQLANLNASLPYPTSTVTAPVSGYFMSVTDGYETALSGKSLDEITPEFLKDLKPEAAQSGVIGKIVSDYEWYIACTVSLNDSLKFKEDDELTLRVNGKASDELSVTVKKVNISTSSDTAVMVLSCGSLSRELASMRNGSFTIVNKSYSGLRIPKKALRIVKEKTGVYVLTGMSIKFVPVNVVYTVDDYVICEQQKSNENVLRLYDEVVVKGKKLYDGKTVG